MAGWQQRFFCGVRYVKCTAIGAVQFHAVHGPTPPTWKYSVRKMSEAYGTEPTMPCSTFNGEASG